MNEDYSWQCNACGSDEFTSSVSEDSFDNDGMSCTNCGGTEFHKVSIPTRAGGGEEMSKQQADVKDYTDELVAGILAVAGRACETKTPSQSPCWCEILNGKHSTVCLKLRKLVKAAKGRSK